MNNSNIENLSNAQQAENQLRHRFVAYFSIFIIGLGLAGNTASFMVFRFHPSFKTMSSMVFLSFVAVSDTIALFEWNLSHFTTLVYGFDIMTSSLTAARVLLFLQCTCLQISALTLSVMCVDRYVTVMAIPGSFLHKLPFRTVKSAFYWSLGIILFCVFLNGHLLFTVGN